VAAEDLGEPLPPNMRPDLKTLTDPAQSAGGRAFGRFGSASFLHLIFG